MLNELRIKNFVIIDDLIISFNKGLNILTGETGAGKSILIDALSGVLGEKMTTDMIRTGFEKASLESSFDITGQDSVKSLLAESGIDCEDDLLILRRELYSSGRGRSFANSVQIPVSRLKEISEYLMALHGQNEHHNITKISKHRNLLDNFGDNEEFVDKIKKIHARLHEIINKLESFEIDEREKLRRIEYNSFAIKEIESVSILPGEDVELKSESSLLSNAEKLFKEVNNSSSMLNDDEGVLQKLRKIENNLSNVSEYDIEISNILEVIKESLFSLEDISSSIRDYGKNIDFSPERLNEIEERRSVIADLKKKYGDTIEEVLEFAAKATRELHDITSSEEELEKLKVEKKTVIKEAKEIALELSERRTTAAKDLEEGVMKELNDLGMGGTVFRVSIKREVNPEGEIEAGDKRYVLYPHGLDRVEFLIAANEGEDLKPMRKVASGGEMSRLMLALKNVILSKDIVDSLVFDEVDTGISGKIAESVGKKLKHLSRDRQVLLITHLPQIAAMSDSHYSVQKGKTGDRVTTVVKRLNNNEKVREVARMLAGEKITDLSIKHAEEMIIEAENF